MKSKPTTNHQPQGAIMDATTKARKLQANANLEKSIKIWQERIARNNKVRDNAIRLICEAQKNIADARRRIQNNLDAINDVKKEKPQYVIDFEKAQKKAKKDYTELYSFNNFGHHYEARGIINGTVHYRHYYPNGSFRDFTDKPLTRNEAENIAWEDLEEIHRFTECPDFFDVIGETGGDARHFRYYKNGDRCEK